MSDEYKLEYRDGSRWVEKVIAWALALTVVFLLAIYTKRFSQRTLEGLFYGVFATFFINGLPISAFAEGNLIMLAMAAIGISLGWAALGMGIVGWLLFMLINTVLMGLVNFLIFHETSK